ncbi:unnamed protein product [Ectocarpus fasciculatus]
MTNTQAHKQRRCFYLHKHRLHSCTHTHTVVPSTVGNDDAPVEPKNPFDQSPRPRMLLAHAYSANPSNINIWPSVSWCWQFKRRLHHSVGTHNYRRSNKLDYLLGSWGMKRVHAKNACF